MALSQTVQEELCLKLGAVGVPEPLRQRLVSTISTQVVAEGPENVVKRLKVLKQAAVNAIAGVPVELPWIAHTRQGPKGVWKPVWRWLTSQKHKTKVRALNTMMVYASLVLPRQAGPTPTQERKFLGSVVLPVGELVRRLEKLNDAVYQKGLFRRGTSVLNWKLQSKGWKADTEKGIPFITDYLARKYGTTADAVRKSERVVERFLGREEFYPFHSFPQVKLTLGEYGEDWFDLTHPWNGAHLDWKGVSPPEDPIGVIGFTQEPGAKLRAFASPNWVIQAATQGLKQNLLEALSSCDWDCTHDQTKGVLGVQRWLREGRKVFSVDLSDATNNFPLRLQLMVLRFLGIPEQDLKLLELVSRSPYEVLWGEHQVVSWSIGQPLGAGPSFMAFALTHAVVALEAEIQAGVPDEDLGSNFYILGDDIVISDEKVHQCYRELLDVLSCPVSESKCLQSSVASEFAGKLITDDHVYHGYKYRAISDLSFMDVIRGLGAQAIKILSPAQQAYARLVWEVPEPMGLGFNPKGRPLAERWMEYLYVIEALEQVEPDINVVRPEELRTAFMYNTQSRWWRYFESDRTRDMPSIVGGSPPSMREQALNWAKQAEQLVSPTIVGGDPRPNPLKGWTSTMIRRILPVMAAARERFQEIGHAQAVDITS